MRERGYDGEPKRRKTFNKERMSRRPEEQWTAGDQREGHQTPTATWTKGPDQPLGGLSRGERRTAISGMEANEEGGERLTGAPDLHS